MMLMWTMIQGTASTYEEVRDKVKGLFYIRMAAQRRWTSCRRRRRRRSGDLMRKTTVRCAEQWTKVPCDHATACLCFAPTSSFASGKSKGQDKERAKDTAKEASPSSMSRPIRREEERAAKEKALARANSATAAAMKANFGFSAR